MEVKFYTPKREFAHAQMCKKQYLDGGIDVRPTKQTGAE